MMVKPRLFEIAFSNPRRVYKLGLNEKVAGVVRLYLDEPLRQASLILKVSGKAYVAFSRDTGGKRKQHYFTKEQYFRRSVPLWPSENSGQYIAPLEQGNHEFPFTFNLPVDIPSSFESREGSVRYCAKAELRTGSFDSTVREFFVIIRPLDLNRLVTARDPLEQEEDKTLCCMCCASGNISAVVSIPRRGFVPGEIIPVQAEIFNNSSTSVSKSYFNFKRIAECHAMGKTETVHKFLETRTPPVEHGAIAAGSSDKWTGQEGVIVPLAVPSKLESCYIIDLEYQLVLNVIVPGMHCNMLVPVEIVIGTEPLADRPTTSARETDHARTRSAHSSRSPGRHDDYAAQDHHLADSNVMGRSSRHPDYAISEV